MKANKQFLTGWVTLLCKEAVGDPLITAAVTTYRKLNQTKANKAAVDEFLRSPFSAQPSKSREQPSVPHCQTKVNTALTECLSSIKNDS